MIWTIAYAVIYFLDFCFIEGHGEEIRRITEQKKTAEGTYDFDCIWAKFMFHNTV